MFRTEFIPRVLLGLKDFSFVLVFEVLKARVVHVSKGRVFTSFNSAF